MTTSNAPAILGEKYSFDAVKILQAYEPTPRWRIYGGYLYTIRWEHSALGRNALQSGLEWTSRPWEKGSAQTYWATDLQNWQRIAWNPMFHTQLGFHFRHDAQAPQTFSPYIEFAAGTCREQGQFYYRRDALGTGYPPFVPVTFQLRAIAIHRPSAARGLRFFSASGKSGEHHAALAECDGVVSISRAHGPGRSD